MAYKLTPKGEILAQKIPMAHEAESAILIYLYEHKEPIESDELVGELRTKDSVVIRTLNRLINEEYVKEV